MLRSCQLHPTFRWSLPQCRRGVAGTEDSKETKAESKQQTQAEMAASGAGHERSLAWSEEAGIGVLMSAELIFRKGGIDEE
ncbi:hypothetical protein BLNAU_15689 [Blattamonas nauphoetae]|uniref:Uncharacterized protein n=1 Tax=Blattamonas nauphoetae TaxID=2049346 RepID=A0ABQ9XAA5_9EUKA|nr:hypothetical protein BLNAU_15689 [Blattamonas nauphoetae]